MTGKLAVDKAGRVTGPIKITYNDPFPCVNGKLGVTGKMNGVLMHTMVGFLGDMTHGTVELFNREGFGASAHFGIAQNGHVWQFGPLGAGWEAWHAFAANIDFYGIEFEDAGNPDNPISDAALTAAAQLVECLSAFAGFDLRVLDNPAGQGFAYHSLSDAWNRDHHSCPDLPPRHVRSAQRGEIIRRAKAIRSPAPPAPHLAEHVTVGQMSLAQLARQHYPGMDLAAAVERVLAGTMAHATPAQFAAVLRYAAAVLAGKIPDTEHMPEGLHLWVRVS